MAKKLFWIVDDARGFNVGPVETEERANELLNALQKKGMNLRITNENPNEDTWILVARSLIAGVKRAASFGATRQRYLPGCRDREARISTGEAAAS